MRPDIDPATGELLVLALIAALAWFGCWLTALRSDK